MPRKKAAVEVITPEIVTGTELVLSDRRPFQAKDASGKSQAQMVYEILRTLDFGDVLTYEDANAYLPFDLRTKRGPLYKAIEYLEDRDHRTLVVVPGVGYRCAEPMEHETLAVKHHKRSRKQLRLSHRKLQSADRTKMTAMQARRVDEMAMIVARQVELMRRIDTRLQAVETAVVVSRAEQRQKHGELSDEVARLREALVKRGILDESKEVVRRD